MKPDSDIKDPMRTGTEARKDWMGILSRTRTDRLESIFAEVGPKLAFEHLRPPEVGMAMVRARAEARGTQFNLGEMTVTRCSIRLEDGSVGHGYVAGRDKRHAELAAVLDALLQNPDHGSTLHQTIIAPLARELARSKAERASKTAATKVNFFTMVRGQD